MRKTPPAYWCGRCRTYIHTPDCIRTRSPSLPMCPLCHGALAPASNTPPLKRRPIHRPGRKPTNV